MELSAHKCDCGFKWIHGQSGSHHCPEYYMNKVQRLEGGLKYLLSLSVDDVSKSARSAIKETLKTK